jgi:hypothetical protein
LLFFLNFAGLPIQFSWSRNTPVAYHQSSSLKKKTRMNTASKWNASKQAP